MRRICLTLSALSCVCSAACAQGDSRAVGAAPANDSRYTAMASAGQPAPWPLVRSANDCAPGRPEAVWGAGSAPLGYACSDSANGQ
jgi:hypothetical protein